MKEADILNQIKLLDNNTINKIAAGEVVERPSSVIKELVENAIDAGAGNITIEIKDGGTTFIRITDDGSGIPADQVKTAFLRHATSKISAVEDLESVFSLGFRGEALASIAAVSKAEMVTKTRDSELGTRIRINGGILEEIKPCGAADGTTITIEDIFYNVPARRKFLKKPATESGYISDIVNKFILGHPEVAFKYINNNTTIIQTSGNNDLKTAMFHVYGKDAATKMLELSSNDKEMKLKGLIGKPELSRANRTYENLFINGRYIKSDVVANAAEEAYKTRLMIGKFPVYVMELTIDPSLVDVNVHPAKLEVRFRDDDAVYNFVYNSIVKTFKDKILIKTADWESKPSIEVKEFKEKNVTEEPLITQKESESKSVIDIAEPYFDGKKVFDNQPKKSAGLRSEALGYMNKLSSGLSEAEKLNGSILFGKADEPTGVKEEHRKYDTSGYTKKLDNVELSELNEISETKTYDESKPFFDNYRIVGQIFGTYWIVEQNKSIFVIDQHAAHERILFEEFSDKFKNGTMVSQKLFDAEHLVLSETEKNILDENKELFEKFGFELSEKDNEWYMSAVPYIFDKPADSAFLTDMLDMINTEKMANVYDSKLLSIATMACKAAVKARDYISVSEAEEMIKRLLTLENPFNCPHGRPTIIEMTEYELEKKFKRIQ